MAKLATSTSAAMHVFNAPMHISTMWSIGDHFNTELGQYIADDGSIQIREELVAIDVSNSTNAMGLCLKIYQRHEIVAKASGG